MKTLFKALLSFFLIVALANLSIQIWNTSMLFAEINEEIENVLDDETSEQALLTDGSNSNSADISLRDYRNHHCNEFGYSCDYFEIDSPPPKFV